MERSCSFVDEAIYKDEKLTIVHELQKYRFMQVRKSLDCCSAFDAQIEKLVSNRRVYILSELENISDNSAFGQIHYETELLLDHAWQIKRWDLGIEECDRLLNSILKIEERKNSDMVIQSVGVLKDKIKRCKTLFLFMLGIGDKEKVGKHMKKSTYSNEIAKAVEQFLKEKNWHFDFLEKAGLFKFDLKISSKIRKIKYVIDVKNDELVVYGICPVHADEKDEEMMAQMSEFLHRANYGLKNGCFEFDYEDGEIGFRSYIDCDGRLPSAENVKNSIYCTAAMFEQYGDGITSIVFADYSAQEAIAMCEKPLEEQFSDDELDEAELEEAFARLVGGLGGVVKI